MVSFNKLSKEHYEKILELFQSEYTLSKTQTTDPVIKESINLVTSQGKLHVNYFQDGKLKIEGDEKLQKEITDKILKKLYPVKGTDYFAESGNKGSLF